MNNKEKKSAKEVINYIISGLKKRWYIYVGVLTVIIAVCLTVSILNRQKANGVEEYINGKTFVFFDSYGDYKAYSFNNGKMGYEAGYKYSSEKDGSLKGNISDYIYDLDISASVFSEKIWISDKEKYSLPGSVAVYLDNGIVKKYKHTDSTPEWREVTLEELDNLRRDCICNHEFSNWTTILDATKDSKGQKERVCTKCQKSESLEFHNPWLHQPSIQEFYNDLKNKFGENLSELQINDWSSGMGPSGEGYEGKMQLNFDNLSEEIEITVYSCDIYGVFDVGVSFYNEFAKTKITDDILDILVEPFNIYFKNMPDYNLAFIKSSFEKDVYTQEFNINGDTYFKVISGCEIEKNGSIYDFYKHYFNDNDNGGSQKWGYAFDFTLNAIEGTETYDRLYWPSKYYPEK